MANKLHYNVVDLRTQATALDRIRRNLDRASKSLTTNLELLKTEWVSDSSTRFFNEYDVSWIQYIEKYCAMLDEVVRELMWTAQQYESVTEEYDRIRLDV